MELDPLFEPLLRSYDLATLDRESATIYGMWDDLRLAYTNAGWRRFAEENQGGDVLARWKPGVSIANALPAAVARFYQDHYASVLATQVPWEHTYQCPSALLSREIQMRVVPLPPNGLLVINTRIVEAPRPPASAGFSPATHVDDRGFVVQCAHCRRIRRTDDAFMWEFVPSLIDRPLRNTSHGLCEPCLAHYYRAPGQWTPADDNA